MTTGPWGRGGLRRWLPDSALYCRLAERCLISHITHLCVTPYLLRSERVPLPLHVGHHAVEAAAGGLA